MNWNFGKKLKSEVFSRKLELLAAFFILILIIYFHSVVFHYTGGLIRDEASSAALARHPLFTGIHLDLLYDSFPPFSTVIFHVSNLINASDQGFRFLGFIIGLAVLFSFWQSSRMLKLGIPLIALALFELSPVALRYGDGIRPYGIGIFFILLTFGLVWKLATTENSWKLFALTSLTAVISVQTMYQNAFLLLAICLGGAVVAFTHKDWKKGLLILSVGIIAAGSLLPYVGFLKHASDWSSVARYENQSNPLWSILGSALGTPGIIFVLISVEVIAGGVLIFYILPSRKNVSNSRKDLFNFSLVTLLAASVSFLPFLKSTKIPIQVWYFIPLIAIWGICLEALFEVLITNNNLKRNLKVFLVLVVVVLTTQSNLQTLKQRTTNVDIISEYLSSAASKSDLILVNSSQVGVGFNRYYHGSTPWLTVPELSDHTIFRYDLLKKKMSEKDAIASDLAGVQQTLRSGGKIFLINIVPPVGVERLQKIPTGENLPLANMNLYIDAWTWQLDEFLNQHAREHKPIRLTTDQEINSIENVSLTQFQGWRE